MIRKRKRYDRQFKIAAAKVVLGNDVTARELFEELGIKGPALKREAVFGVNTMTLWTPHAYFPTRSLPFSLKGLDPTTDRGARRRPLPPLLRKRGSRVHKKGVHI